MIRNTQKPPRNRDQELPPRTGDSIEHTTPPERGQDEGERNAPLPEEVSPTLKKRRNMDGWSTGGRAAPLTGSPAASSV